MTSSDSVYRKLQHHLDQQPVGYPKTLSGSEIGILKHIFSPDEAELALSMDYKFRPVEEILKRIGSPEFTLQDLGDKLFAIASKGGIGYRNRDGSDHYALMPLVVGMYEGHLEHLSESFVRDFNKYTKSLPFGISFMSTHVPQMRTIPVGESVIPENKASTFDEVSHLLEVSPGPFVVVDCICRKKKRIEGESCKTTERKETCMAVNEVAEGVIKANVGREITKEEAISLINENVKEGLILQPSNTQNIEFICSCCGCCCGMLSIHKKIRNPSSYWATNFYAELVEDSCNACGMCSTRCQVEAIKFKKRKGKTNLVSINSKKCIGCGNCVIACKFDGVRLMKKTNEIIPPADTDELYDTIMEHKKSGWENFKTATKNMLGLSGNT